MQKSLKEYVEKRVAENSKKGVSRRVIVRDVAKRGKVVARGLEIILNDRHLKDVDFENLCVGVVMDSGKKGSIICSVFLGTEEEVKKYLNTFGGADIKLLK